MIHENFPVEKQEKKEFPLLPENVYQCELVDVNLEEKPKYQEPNEKEKKFSFQFALLAGVDKDGKSLRGRSIWKNFVPVYLYIGKNGKNSLYQVIEALLGRELSLEEESFLSTDFINNLVGKQARLIVKQTAGKDGKVYSNIDSLLSIEGELKGLTPEEREACISKKNKDEAVEESEIRAEDVPF